MEKKVVRSGFINPDVNQNYELLGLYGHAWSKTASMLSRGAFLRFALGNTMSTTYYAVNDDGFPLRCLVST